MLAPHARMLTINYNLFKRRKRSNRACKHFCLFEGEFIEKQKLLYKKFEKLCESQTHTANASVSPADRFFVDLWIQMEACELCDKMNELIRDRFEFGI